MYQCREEINKRWLNFQGDKVLGSSMCMQIEKDWKWVLVVEEDEAEALAPIIRFRNLSILIGIIVLSLVVLAALTTAHTISEPIWALEEGADIIGKGNLDHKVGTDARDEIGRLSRAFDRMTESLKKITASRDELDREVKERKQVEEELRASERKYRSLVGNALVGVYQTNIKEKSSL